MLQILLLTFKPAVETITSLPQQLHGLRLLGSYLLLFDHNRRSSQRFFLPQARFLHHFTRSCGVSLKTQSRLTKSRCPNISHFLAPLSIPCSTVHHFDCSFSLPPCPDIFPYNIHRPSFLPSTRPKLKLHLLVIQHHSCPSSLVLRCITLSSRIQVPRLLSTPHLVLSRRSCSCNIVYLEPVEAYYLHMQKERYSRLHSQIPLPSHYWPILQVYS